MNVVLRGAFIVTLAGVLSSCSSSGPTPSPTQVPSPPPPASPPPTTEPPSPPAPTPQPPTPTPPPSPPPETTYVMSGYVRDQLTNGTIANARLDVIQGLNTGKTAFSDSGGLYRFEQLKAGATRVRITAADYDSRESDVTI